MHKNPQSITTSIDERIITISVKLIFINTFNKSIWIKFQQI